MGLFSWIARALKLGEGPQVEYLAINRGFPPLDLDEIKSRLDLHNIARVRGERNLPSPKATDYDEIETQIKNLIEESRARAVARYWADIRADDQAIGSVDILNSISKMRTASSGARSELEVIGTNTLMNLTTLQRRYLSKKADLDRFTQDNKLTRSASIKTRDHKIFQVGAGVFICVAEAGANSLLLGDNAAGGYLEGTVIAFAISLFNVVPALVAGAHFWRWTNHVKVSKRVTGYLLIAVWLAWVMAANFFAGHLRDALMGPTPEQAESLAIRTFSAGWLGWAFLTETRSYLLVAAGILVAGLMCWDAYKFDDPYPGFGAKTRDARKALNQFYDARLKAQAALKVHRETAVRTMQSAREMVAGLQSTVSAALARRSSTVHNFGAHLEHLDAAGKTLITIYREQNTLARSADAPPHFARPFTISSKETPHPGEPIIMPGDQISALMSEASKEIDEAVVAIDALYQSHANACSDLKDLV